MSEKRARSVVLSLKEQVDWSGKLKMMPDVSQDIYYSPEYYNLYEQNGEGRAYCYVFEFGSDVALYPFLINEINSLGYDLDRKYYDIQGAYGYNGVLSSTLEHPFIEIFNRSFESYCRRENIVAEFTRFHPLLKNQSFSAGYLQPSFDRKTVYLDLKSSYEDIFQKFQTTTRKQIKRAINRYHLEVKRFANDIDQLDVFLPIYYETMDRVHSVPYLYFNKPYFRLLLESTPNVCFVAYYNGKPIASIIAFYNRCYMHGYLGGALTEYLNLSSFSLLYSEMIKFGQSMGCRYFHVGGGATNREDDPVFRFKKNFSETTADFYVGKKIHNQEVYQSVIQQWEQKYPEKKEIYEHLLLKYRY